jgi:hypothetical protein
MAEADASFSNLSSDYVLKAGEINALGAEAEAVEVKRKTLQYVSKYRRLGSQVMGQAVSRYAKAGVEMEGTPLVVLNDSANEIEKDIANVIASGSAEEQKALLQASIYRMSAGLASLQSQSQAASALTKAGEYRIYGDQALLSGNYLSASDLYQGDTVKYNSYGTLLTGLGNLGSRLTSRTMTVPTGSTYTTPSSSDYDTLGVGLWG